MSWDCSHPTRHHPYSPHPVGSSFFVAASQPQAFPPLGAHTSTRWMLQFSVRPMDWKKHEKDTATTSLWDRNGSNLSWVYEVCKRRVDCKLGVLKQGDSRKLLAKGERIEYRTYAKECTCCEQNNVLASQTLPLITNH